MRAVNLFAFEFPGKQLAHWWCSTNYLSNKLTLDKEGTSTNAKINNPRVPLVNTGPGWMSTSMRINEWKVIVGNLCESSQSDKKQG